MVPAWNPANERIKREYFDWSKNAKGRSELTIAHAGRAICTFDEFNGYRDFKTFNNGQATAFRQHLSNDPSETTGAILTLATQNGILVNLRAFFTWLADQPKYCRTVKRSHADYFALNRHERAIASTRSAPKASPTCEQVVHALRLIPCETDIEKRDRALIAFLLLTCVRVGSAISLKLKHIELDRDRVFLDAREVATKFGKTFYVNFFPVDPMVREIVADWVDHLRVTLGMVDDDPLFPATAQVVGKHLQFTNAGLSRTHWQTSGSVRDALKRQFVALGLPYFHPHAFRDTLVQLGQQRCRTAEDFKAWSQNMGHDDVMTSFRAYGAVSQDRQAEIIRDLDADGKTDEVFDQARMLRLMADQLDQQRHKK